LNALLPGARARARLPPDIEAALAEIFGLGVKSVRLVPHSRYARLHGKALATTRRNTIYLRGDLANFAADPQLLLHEYFHVLHQWRPRRLTLRKYLVESFKRGYWKNRFEIEAREFTLRNVHQLSTLIAQRRGFASRSAARMTLPDSGSL
jgi:hypothetical protein